MGDSIALSVVSGKHLLTAVLPEKEMFVFRDSILEVLIIGNLILFGVIFLLISYLLQKVVINGIYSVNDSLNKITGGDLEQQVSVSTTAEFCTLSNGINATVSALKKAIENEAKRIDAELEMGRMIQTSVLPVDFAGDERYRLHAGMFTAREVGGDFYDFFAIDKDHLAILIADVSGKGITAALYMMTAKTLLKELILKHPVAEAFELANQELCKNNKAHMFLTAFAGVIDLRTGVMTCVNAGHNPPVVKYADGTAEYLKTKHSLVLSASRKARYTAVDLQLKKNDKIILYTDGVTEAMNCSKQLFGEEQLLKTLSSNNISPEEIVHLIRAEVSNFAGSEPQNDDITLLVMEYR
jgi:serine phosphatase RsbU (regulator of sigma subunit)